MNVNIAMRVLIKRNTSKSTSNQFMRGRNPMNVNFALKLLIKENTSKSTSNQFMRGKTS